MKGDEDQQDNFQPMPQRQHPMQGESPSSHAQPSYEVGRHRRPKRPGPPPTNPAVWFVGACCALMSTIVILGGVVVLIVYLVFRPKSPLLDIQSATLNAAYLDTGTLLNADITILANFSNPNRKVHVAFSYVQVDLKFMDTMVATQAVEPFAERPGESELKSLHMVASEVPLPPTAAEEWKRGTSEEGVAMEVAGRFRTRSDLGKWLHFTYWLYGHCTIVIGAPPSGVLLSSRCRTKR
ncbi:NDR1/HIN1-Like protein 3 [Cocos nucifera]|uniref:NDR1/HIN1-Like protein 3 n=1 Tax=Cocos nucifera TaxID=13894 RepID=A0A8K0IH04_COCNU|nr:NDR1/HIN1-Like protein 3 [Cocos nucifera]